MKLSTLQISKVSPVAASSTHPQTGTAESQLKSQSLNSRIQEQDLREGIIINTLY